jgi:hypothetical protein
MLSTLRQTSGQTDVPFSRDAIEAWKRRVCLSDATKAKHPARTWEAILTNLEVRSTVALHLLRQCTDAVSGAFGITGVLECAIVRHPAHSSDRRMLAPTASTDR